MSEQIKQTQPEPSDSGGLIGDGDGGAGNSSSDSKDIRETRIRGEAGKARPSKKKDKYAKKRPT